VGRVSADDETGAVGVVVAVVALGITAVAGVLLVVVGAVVAVLGGTGAGASARPSALAAARVPPAMLALYIAADAAVCPAMPWQVLAAVGTVESGSGTSALRGVTSGASVAGAQGPLQLKPATFARYALPVPAGGAVPPSPYDAVDAVYAAARMLCASGGATGAYRDAILAYSHSTDYVGQVWATAVAYGMGAGATPAGGAAGRIADPVAGFVLTQGFTWRCTPAGCAGHPGLDLAVPIGTPVLAPVTGVVHVMADDPAGYGHWVTMTGTDATEYRFGHLSAFVAADGDSVAAGDVIALSGNSGDSTGPHRRWLRARTARRKKPAQ